MSQRYGIPSKVKPAEAHPFLKEKEWKNGAADEADYKGRKGKYRAFHRFGQAKYAYMVVRS